MVQFKIVVFFILFFGLIPGLSFAQLEDEFKMKGKNEVTPSEKKIKPEIKMWSLDGYGAFQDSTRLDTLQDYFHLFNPVYKKVLTATYLGNYGTPYLNNDFFNRQPNIDFFFLKSREAYLLTPQAIQYYNTRTPYTRLDFSQSEHKNRKNETRFNVLHSQNVNPYLNFTFRYDQAKSQGQYQNQDSKNNFVTLYSSYNHENLSIHGGFISNSIGNKENGGLNDDNDIFNGKDSEVLNVKLSSSSSQFSSSYFFVNGEYRIGKTIEQSEDKPPLFKPIVGLLYSFKLQRHKQEFIDEEDTSNNFFRNTYFDDTFSKDSIRFNKITNIIQIKQYENADKKTSFGKRIFLGQEYVKLSFPGTNPEVFTRKTKKYSNIYVGGGIFRKTGNFWTWNFEGKIYLLGRNTGQTELSGIISKPLNILGDSLALFSVNGTIENRVADIFQEEFYSNHFWWNNGLKMEQRMVVKGSFWSPKRKLELGANYAIINNFIYNDTLAVPAQTGTELLVLSAFLDKDFNYRNLHFRTRLLWQKVSNEEFLHLPDFSTFISAYYKFVISKVMFAQIGLDTRYNTSYYADDYSPATGLFYLQRKYKLGEFPYLDAYASFRLKRTRVFFKMMNVGTEFIHKEYFTTPHYPMNRATFRLGVSWAFYD